MSALARLRAASASLALLLALGGCTGEAETAESGSPSPRPPEAAPPTTLPLPDSVLCGGRGILDVWIPVERLLEQRPATELGPRGAAAVQRQDLGPHAQGVAFDSLPSDWFIAEETEERVILLQPLPLPEGMPADSPGAVGLADFSMRLFLIDPPVPADLDQWYPVFENECTFLIPLEGLSSPDLMIDERANDDPAATHLDVLVRERECVSGRSAEGRIQVVALRETTERIEVAIGVRPLGEAVVTCQGNPLTPFRLELGSAVGDREIVDIGRVPPLVIPAVDADGR